MEHPKNASGRRAPRKQRSTANPSRGRACAAGFGHPQPALTLGERGVSSKQAGRPEQERPSLRRPRRKPRGEMAGCSELCVCAQQPAETFPGSVLEDVCRAEKALVPGQESG